MVQPPFDSPPPNVAKTGENLFLTHVGGESTYAESLLHPNHTRAFHDIQDFVVRHDPKVRSFSIVAERPFNRKAWEKQHWFQVYSPVKLHPDKPSEIDSDGNTFLNRLMMSHFFVSESVAMRVFDMLAKDQKVSMRPNRFGQTPLMLAVEAGWPKVVERLLQNGARLGTRDKDSHDAIDYLRFTAIRPSDDYCAVVYNSDLIAISLLKQSSQDGKDSQRIKPILAQLRDYGNRIDFRTGIVPEQSTR